MKILMILDNLSCDSGVSTIVMNLYNKFDKNKMKIDFLIFKESNTSYINIVREKGSEVFCLKNPLDFKQSLVAILELKNFFKKNAKNYDIVHLHSPTLNEFTLRYAKKYGIRNRIIHSHSTMMSSNKLKNILHKILLRNVNKYANNYWACSTEAANFLYGKKFCDAHSIELVKNAVEISKYRYNSNDAERLKKEYNVQNKMVVAHISNFSLIKNVMFLIPIIEEVVAVRKDIVFVFVGDGITKRKIEKKIIEKKLEKYCMFIGRKNNIQNILNLIDVILLPSIKEGLPVVAIEAQANGILCLVSDSITKESDIGNIKFIPLNHKIWSDEIIKIKPISAEQRIKLYKHIDNTDFNIDREGKRIQEIYISMM